MNNVRYFFFLLMLLPALVSGQIISTIAGNGTAGYSGDESSAISAKLNTPYNVKFDHAGNIYIADQINNVIRKITDGVITTVVGNSTTSSICADIGDGGPATAAELCLPDDITFDESGNMYISEFSNGLIRKVSTSGIISTFAGGGASGLGDGGQATAAELTDPLGLVFDGAGNMYFSDNGAYRVRKISTTGIITTVVGTGTPGYNGDGIPAITAQIHYPGYIAISPKGELFIADYANHRIRMVNSAGIITTVAGTGIQGYTGDNGPATGAKLNSPCGILFDKTGNYYISDETGSPTIRKVDTSGIITTIAGTGIAGFSGDGGPATAAQINNIALCSAIDAYGNLYIADSKNNRIRRIVYDEAAVNDVNKAANNIQLFPNPTQNELTIKSGTEIKSVQIINILGMVQALPIPVLNQKEVILSVVALPPGMYYIKVNELQMGKFVKE